MRSIKFRGKRIDNGEWVYGSLVKGSYNTFIIPEYDDSIQPPNFRSVDPSTVGQFTGLHDKDGKEIWEGDVVTDSERHQIVAFGDMYNGMDEGIGWLLCGIPESDDNSFFLSPNDAEVVTVIGNIHDNPELL